MPLFNSFINTQAAVKLRAFPIILLLLALLPATAAGDGLLDTATRFARNGAPQLALARIERDQPPQREQPDQSITPQWFQWEAMRLSLLVELGLDQEALQRASQLPPEIPAESHTLYLYAAQAAKHRNDAHLTREYLAKWLWLGELNDIQKKNARRMTIQSYIAQHRSDMAYLAMLRFQLDYQPLSAADVTHFVEQLLLVGGITEASGWLAQLDDATPLKLLLRLKSGLITPEAAITAAKAALEPPPLQPPAPPPPPPPAPPPPPLASAKNKGKKPPTVPVAAKKTFKVAPVLQAKLSEKDVAAYWSIIALAAEMQNNPALLVEALERQLNLSASQEDGLFNVDTEMLLQAYAELASKVAGQAQLLPGDDAAWLELATRTTSPLEARALYASLSPQNASLELRITAETNLAELLLNNKREIVALRLFATDSHFPAANPALLAKLGEVALRNPSYPQSYQLAAKYLRGVDTPQTDIPPVEWQLKRAQAFVLGGMPDEAVATVKRIYSEMPKLDFKATTEILRIAFELDGRQHNGAEILLLQLAAFADSRQWGEIYLALGRITDGRKEFAKAAEYYLQAAEWSEGTKARQQAADCMVRAGLKEDAKRQYNILLKAAKTHPEQVALKQALSRL